MRFRGTGPLLSLLAALLAFSLLAAPAAMAEKPDTGALFHKYKNQLFKKSTPAPETAPPPADAEADRERLRERYNFNLAPEDTSTPDVFVKSFYTQVFMRSLVAEREAKALAVAAVDHFFSGQIKDRAAVEDALYEVLASIGGFEGDKLRITGGLYNTESQNKSSATVKATVNTEVFYGNGSSYEDSAEDLVRVVRENGHWRMAEDTIQ